MDHPYARVDSYRARERPRKRAAAPGERDDRVRALLHDRPGHDKRRAGTARILSTTRARSEQEPDDYRQWSSR